MKKYFKMTFFAVLFTTVMVITSFAYSPNWYQEGGNWKIRDDNGNTITNTLLCDDNKWYILDPSGNMVVYDLVENNEGKYYSIETHAGENYGALRCASGYYDGVYLEIDPTSGVIKNQDGIIAIKNNGHEIFHINHNNVVYTSSFIPQHTNNIFQDDDWEEFDFSSGNYIEIMRSQHVGMFLKGKEAREIIEQTLAEFDSHNISISDELAGVLVRGPLGDSITIFSLDSDMCCRFIDPATGALLPVISKTKSVKNIKKAIYKLSR